MAERPQAMRQPNYRKGFRSHAPAADAGVPLRWKRPQTIFVNSMIDLFPRRPQRLHRARVDVMRRASWHRLPGLDEAARESLRYDRVLR